MKYRVGQQFMNVQFKNVATIDKIIDDKYSVSWISKTDLVPSIMNITESKLAEHINDGTLTIIKRVPPIILPEELFTL